MTALRLQIGLLSFAVLSSAVYVNLFYMQPLPASKSADVAQSKDLQAAVAQPYAPESAANTAVNVIQRELQNRGYTTGPAGNTVTPVLQAAIMAYEFDQGLPLTGEPGEALVRTIILGPGSADAAPLAGAKPGPAAQQIIATTQQMMTRLGYGPLPQGGTMTEALASAIRRFEREQGMTETGRISGDLVTKLNRQSILGTASARR